MLMEAKRNGANPKELAKQFISSATPEQLSTVLSNAKQLGVPDSILSQLQNNK